ncbi:zinc-binding dehydrogenase [Nakamurella sp. YIM 132087]|uniref:Zinc-binding dehydrogenase n=1 Tax=Nakamurella alba TaxID=2665158 RepID=A0A7K1FE81_9ACTN|nr:zinc-binding dehydrogenase [Nakamurella alba]MTD12401.1 zinc-binding dehydrogenase [Nakamurella alba]
MRAAVLYPEASAVRIVDVPEPRPATGWAVLEVGAAGLCHTDLHVMEGMQFSAKNTVDYTVTRPRILGHEVAGTVVEVGDPADDEWLGRRVAIGSGEQRHVTPGMHIDGGLAQFCAVPVTSLVTVPDGVPIEIAAVAPDSISTAYSAVHQAGAISAADRVAVIGLGGLGLSAVRIAGLSGATVFGVDIDPSRFAAAEAAGARSCVGDVTELTDEGLSLVIDFVGGRTTSAAVDAVGVAGRVVLVGLGASQMTVSPLSLVLGRKSLIGSLGSPKGQVLRKVLDLIAAGQITPAVEAVPFDELVSAYDRLRSGKVLGRMVTRPND